MAKKTKIEWCDSTLNLSMGCDGCELWNRKAGVSHCYAGRLTDRYGGGKGWPDQFESPRLFLNRLGPALKLPDLTGTERPDKPWLNGMPRLIFLGDMGDTWTESLDTEQWILPALQRMAASPHQFLMLTKRPGRMAEFTERHPLPKNVWPMTTVTSQKTLMRAYWLRKVRGGGPKALSCEPLLGPLDLSGYLGTLLPSEHGEHNYCVRGIDWVIDGGESGPNARPMHPDWPRSLRDQCVEAGVPYFHKQNGEWEMASEFWSCQADGADVLSQLRALRERYKLAFAGDQSDRDLWKYRDKIMVRSGIKSTGRKLGFQEWNQMPTL